jgi:predicted NUDIX family NTP pyrophosphohydrolase
VKKQSAGLLMFRVRDAVLEVLLAHPGGSFWKNVTSHFKTSQSGSNQNQPL